MINQPPYPAPSSPLYGSPAPRDGIVQALMSQIVQNSPQGASSSFAGLNQMALDSLMKKRLNQPAPYTGNANGGTYNYQAPSVLPSWLGGHPGAGYTFTDAGGKVSTLGGALGDFNY